MTRVSLTKKQLATGAGKGLLDLLMSITHDGELSLGEMDSLGQWLSDNTEAAGVPAVAWLRELVTVVLADGRVTQEERAELLLAFERVLPPEERLIAKLKRVAAAEKGADQAVQEPAAKSGPRKPRHEQPATKRQIDYLRVLGAEFDETRITKVEASALIDERLAMGKPVSNRQMMVLRFWNQAALAGKGKEAVSEWMDVWYAEDPRRLKAWELWKSENGDDGGQGDPTRVPVGAGHEYLTRVPISSASSASAAGAQQAQPASTWPAILVLALLCGVGWLVVELLR